jgi:hypothetical protein
VQISGRCMPSIRWVGPLFTIPCKPLSGLCGSVRAAQCLCTASG